VSPGRVDRGVVDRHLIALRQALAALRRHAGISPASLRADSDRRWTVERGLHLCAQNALDIASHIASAEGLDPTTYGSSIDCLVEANVVPAQFGERFRGIAGFRNVLVHGYLEVDLDLTARLLRESLDDFEEFAGHVEQWLADNVAPPTGPPSRATEGEAVLAVGVDGCPAGWFYVVLQPSGTSRWGIVGHLGELVQEVSEPARIFVDIPIGLPNDHSERECDLAARRKLGEPRRRSVFRAPARAVLQAVDYEDAKHRSRAVTGKDLSAQTFGIVPKCSEVDRLLRGNTKARKIIREVHPEVCFWALAGRRPMKHNKGKPEGFRERVAVLKQLRPAAEQEIEGMLSQFARKDVARDDAVDAMVAALTASAETTALRTLPPEPPRDSVGLPMEMVFQHLATGRPFHSVKHDPGRLTRQR
jgi:predicted RNase H-like nuclease/uncharacterized protein YutE (UPF0331/DUF86 family)